jgi:hypothetical protein
MTHQDSFGRILCPTFSAAAATIFLSLIDESAQQDSKILYQIPKGQLWQLASENGK